MENDSPTSDPKASGSDRTSLLMSPHVVLKALFDHALFDGQEAAAHIDRMQDAFTDDVIGAADIVQRLGRLILRRRCREQAAKDLDVVRVARTVGALNDT